MRSVLSILILLFGGFWCVSCQSTHEPQNTWSGQEGYGHLIAAQRFSFGGVGYAGTTSTGEFGFRAVLRSHNAAELFKAAFSQATDEGKLYALCGIRVSDRSAFDSYATILSSTNSVVTTQSGCMIGHERIAAVVKRIADGHYDSQFSTH
jgi:hypothetical protein